MFIYMFTEPKKAPNLIRLNFNGLYRVPQGRTI
jgi:hypothetical protein